jgi:hypothetical protein
MTELPPTPQHYSATIVQRDYVAKQGTSESALKLEIGHPLRDVPVAGGTDWRCPVRISFGQESLVKSAIGVDSLQALQIGLELARIQLDSFAKRRGLELFYLDQPVSFEKTHWHTSLS